MKNWIELSSFSILSFDVIVCLASAKSRQCLQPMPAYQITLTQAGRLLVEVLSPTFSIRINRQVPSRYCLTFEHMGENALMHQTSQ